MKRNQLLEEWMHDYLAFLTVINTTLLLGVWCIIYGVSCISVNYLIPWDQLIPWKNYLYTGMILGGIGVLFIYLYRSNLKLLHGEDISSFQIEDTIVTQIMASFPLQILILAISNIFLQVNPKMKLSIGIVVSAFSIINIVCIILWGIYGKKYITKHWKMYRTLVISGDAFGSFFVDKMQEQINRMFQIQMYVTDDKEIEIMEALINMHDAIILYNVNKEHIEYLEQYCIRQDKKVFLSSDHIKMQQKKLQFTSIAGEPFLELKYSIKSKHYRKRVFDIIIGGIICIISMPMMGIFCLMTFYQNGKCFQEKKMIINGGKETKCFDFYIQNEADLDDQTKGSKFESFLQRTGWYRMPELFAVIIGQMHLVGPIWNEENTLYMDEEFMQTVQNKKYSFKYGLLGISCFSKSDMDQTRKYNRWYIQEESFSLDYYILMMGLKQLLLNGSKKTVKNKYIEDELNVKYTQ